MILIFEPESIFERRARGFIQSAFAFFDNQEAVEYFIGHALVQLEAFYDG